MNDPYQTTIGGIKADPYRIARAYGLDATLGAALKKLLRCGRKHKDAATDVAEAITTLKRWQEMQAEDSELNGGEKPEEPQYTGHVLCPKCGTTHWMHGACPKPFNPSPPDNQEPMRKANCPASQVVCWGSASGGIGPFAWASHEPNYHPTPGNGIAYGCNYPSPPDDGQEWVDMRERKPIECDLPIVVWSDSFGFSRYNKLVPPVIVKSEKYWRPAKLPPPLPDGVPAPKDGWVYAGREILKKPASEPSDIAYLLNDGWEIGAEGCWRNHYAVRVGSEIQRKLFPDYQQ